MRIRAEMGQDPKVTFVEESNRAERAIMSAMRLTGQRVKAAWRQEIQSAGLGRRLANTVRGQSYPEDGTSAHPASLVWSKAPQILRGFEEGAVIRARGGRFLAIPTSAAGKGRKGSRMTPQRWMARTGLSLDFVPLPRSGRGVAMLVSNEMRARRGKRGGFAPASKTARRTGRGLVSVPLFILIPQVKLAKRLDLMRSARQAMQALPAYIASAWED